ncbi:MAG: hypothetical protein DRJ64_00685 [Thermoprotei archaeon]|nr:MAG: hypothetical protein DRJ64_00685 [Thermoprotei archaeon]
MWHSVAKLEQRIDQLERRLNELCYAYFDYNLFIEVWSAILAKNLGHYHDLTCYINTSVPPAIFGMHIKRGTPIRVEDKDGNVVLSTAEIEEIKRKYLKGEG